MGPRPALPAEVATYNDYQRQRLLVKPGLTCYWQTRRNRDSITFDEWVDLDLWHCLDQVLVTTGLVDSVVDVRHLRSINGVSLISRIKPNKSFSDHLPLLVRLSASSEEVSDGR